MRSRGTQCKTRELPQLHINSSQCCVPISSKFPFLVLLKVNKQLADKERVAAALENSHLLKVVNQCLSMRQ